ncbi:MAG: alpha-ketoglutarate-dependent dioxygenase AlkB [Bauldia sp.]|nr:alpha-ketoglutarate-dependent dioxygenase AlkB [Bauldia sp.]
MSRRGRSARAAARSSTSTPATRRRWTPGRSTTPSSPSFARRRRAGWYTNIRSARRTSSGSAGSVSTRCRPKSSPATRTEGHDVLDHSRRRHRRRPRDLRARRYGRARRRRAARRWRHRLCADRRWQQGRGRRGRPGGRRRCDRRRWWLRRRWWRGRRRGRKRRKLTAPAGFREHPAFLDGAAQRALLTDIRAVVADAPFFRPEMPRTGRPMSVEMTSCGAVGWVSDRTGGYRYQLTHPVIGKPWPRMPDSIVAIWRAVAGDPRLPDACLVNHYAPAAKMGLHRDEDEQDFTAPVVSISLGDDCRFRIGGLERGGPTRSLRLTSGDVVVLGGASRLAYHGVDRIYPGTSTLLRDWFPEGGRINLTLRRAT